MKYPALVTDYFFHPRHVGSVNGGIRASFGNVDFGDLLQLDLEVVDNTVKSARFKAVGEPYTIAAMEWLCRQSEGLSLETLRDLNITDCVSALELPSSKHYLLVMLQNCLHSIER